jgi:hypothetical protein
MKRSLSLREEWHDRRHLLLGITVEQTKMVAMPRRGDDDYRTGSVA